MSVLTWESFIVECKRNNGIMVLLKTLRKTVRHKDATIIHYVHCVSLSIVNVLKVFSENFNLKERYLTNEYSYSQYRADFTDSDAVYGSDERLKRNT